jgi:hypothetical protein
MSNVQKMHNDLERSGENDRRRLESQLQMLENQTYDSLSFSSGLPTNAVNATAKTCERNYFKNAIQFATFHSKKISN